MRCTGPGDGDISILHVLVNTTSGVALGLGTRLLKGDNLRPRNQSAMCTWSPREKARAKPRSQGQKKYHYVWELDDGVTRFARHTKRDRLKLFVDSDGDGLFTKADALVGRARIKRPFRGQGRGGLLEDDRFGTILTFNALDPSIDGLHGDLPALVGLTFQSPGGEDVAVFQQVQQDLLI